MSVKMGLEVTPSRADSCSTERHCSTGKRESAGRPGRQVKRALKGGTDRVATRYRKGPAAVGCRVCPVQHLHITAAVTRAAADTHLARASAHHLRLLAGAANRLRRRRGGIPAGAVWRRQLAIVGGIQRVGTLVASWAHLLLQM